MSRNLIYFMIFSVAPISICAKTGKNTEKLEKSLVFLEISSLEYDYQRPWRPPDSLTKGGYACAVSPYRAITTAWNVCNHSLIRARVFGQNVYVPATVLIADYETNLALIELDRESLDSPMIPASFQTTFPEGEELTAYWLSPTNRVVTARGYLEKARMQTSSTSHTKNLSYIISDTPHDVARGRLYCRGDVPIGIASWSDSGQRESGLIPAEIINAFLSDADQDVYSGFGVLGFAASELLDPSLRSYLKLPKELTDGVYLRQVFAMGTGSNLLQKNDVLISIDQEIIDAQGRFTHPEFGKLSFEYLITSKKVGSQVEFVIWRDGAELKLYAEVTRIEADDMLIPFYEYGHPPEYLITGGCVFQPLTRNYFMSFGENWVASVPPHIANYYRQSAFDPTDDRKQIIVLSYVLPAAINLGYHRMGQMVLKSVNGTMIDSLSTIRLAQNFSGQSQYDVYEFELSNPVLVLPKSQLPASNQIIGKNYGIRKMEHFRN